jgi:hypothetical protein
LTISGPTLSAAATTLTAAATMLGLRRRDAYNQRHSGRRDERF